MPRIRRPDTPEIEVARRWLRATQADIDANEAEHDRLIARRRELVSMLRDWGVFKSDMKLDIGRSYMVVTQDLKVMGR
jgi:hypothetical protein